MCIYIYFIFVERSSLFESVQEIGQVPVVAVSSAAAVNLLAWRVDYLPIVKFKSRSHGGSLLLMEEIRLTS